MSNLRQLKAFQVARATPTLWIFRKSSAAGRAPILSGRWIETSSDLDTAMRNIVQAQIGRVEETLEYGLLAQNNEGSALTIDSDETHADQIVAQASEDDDARKILEIDELKGTAFYAFKLQHGRKQLFAVRKTEASWRTKAHKSALTVFFKDAKLGLDNRPTFEISDHIDFIILDGTIFVLQKSNFESVLSYKETHKEDFAALQAELPFVNLFTTMAPLVQFVGDNKMLLRRASAIRQKGHFRDPAFIDNLRRLHRNLGLSIQFDGSGTIVPTAESCKDIFSALLDHRLTSMLSQRVYEVQDAVTV